MIENFTQKNERTVDGSEIPRPTTEFGRPKPWKSMGFYKLFPQLVANSSGFLVAINSITLKNVCCLKNGSFPFHTDRPHWWMIILQHLHLRFGSNRSGCSNYHHDRRVLLHHAPRLPTKKNGSKPSRRPGEAHLPKGDSWDSFSMMTSQGMIIPASQMDM